MSLLVGEIKQFVVENRWGEWSLIALYISLLSGVVVGLQYHPETPLFSSSSQELLIPFGSYFRSLHFYSSQLFFLFSVIHLAVVYQKSESYDQATWVKYILSLPVGLLLLFTGYVLRGDTTGSSAGMIAENILLAIPVVGGGLNNLLFSISDHGMSRVYINHVIGLDLLWLYLLWTHIKRYRVAISSNLFITFILLILCGLVAAPLEIQTGASHITGPWFFVGLQELLRYLPVLLAGVILPGLFIFSLLFLRKENRFFPYLLTFVLLWLIAYSIVTLIGFSR